MMFWESSCALFTAVLMALNPILGENGVGGDYGSQAVHNGFGRRADGTAWHSLCVVGGEHGPWGATKSGDGDSYTVLYTSNNLDPATEQIEHDTPVVVLRKEHVIDTGGPGQHRGGAAHRKDTMFLTDAEHFSSPFRFKSPPGVGANGGRTGPSGGIWIFPSGAGPHGGRGLIGTSPDVYSKSRPVGGVLDATLKTLDPVNGQYHYYASQPVWDTEAGATFRYQTNGGGGWGSPLERDPARVLADVRNEYVSIEGAANDYGVVIVGDPHFDPEGLSIDESATAELRNRDIAMEEQP